jgi:uncharacterized sporulation protein YeaH/YhbH (DUF444 family)
MILNNEGDVKRFRDIVTGKVRKDLRRYMGSGEITGEHGGKQVSVPLPNITIPRLRYGQNQGGVGQGEGGKGQPVDGAGEASDQPGQHTLEIDGDDLAALIGEELQLPPLLPKGQQQVMSEHHRYHGIRRVGPAALRHNRRTFKAALLREVAGGQYQPGQVLIPRKEDMRFRAGVPSVEPRSAAVIFYMMDVSGSMGDVQKALARQTCFWIHLWLSRHFRRVEEVYIIHDSAAQVVDHHAFFRTKQAGGTLISSAYQLMLDQIRTRYPVDDWNIFGFQFSDGDNWSPADTGLCCALLRGQILPACNRFGYAQVTSEYGSGSFLQDISGEFRDDDRLRVAKVEDREDIMDAIRALLG